MDFFRANRINSNYNTVDNNTFFANSSSRALLIPTLFVRTGICSEVKPNWMNGWVCSFVFQKDLPSEISNLKKMQIFVKQMEHNEILLTLLCMGSQN